MELDFTSSLYLGFRHEMRSLRPWSQLTTGAPAALVKPSGSEVVASQLAGLQGCEAVTLAPSTLHLFWDLFGMLANEQITIFLDASAYSIARWGVERAAGRGVPVQPFAHNKPEALEKALRRGMGRRPVVVTDGLCTACGCAVPIADYLNSVRRASGLLIIDDTQALGILGAAPMPSVPYGSGGGGSLPHQAISGPDLLVISSLAKGFGVPLAALGGSVKAIRQFEAQSDTRVHCSPPSAVAISAAEHALKINLVHGDILRARLLQRIQYFQRRLTLTGLAVEGGLFPVQTLRPQPHLDVRRLHQQLLQRGIRTILRQGCAGGDPRLSFAITARHRPDEIKRAVRALERFDLLSYPPERGTPSWMKRQQ